MIDQRTLDWELRARLGRFVVVTTFFGSALACAAGLSSGNYAIPSSTLNAGVGEMASGSFTLSSSLGDPFNTGPSASPNYLLAPGFWATVGSTVPVIEFYNAGQDHYFISSLQPDINALDTGKFVGWVRTGLSFMAYAGAIANASPVCRFYIPPAVGDSHFYSASPAECAQTATKFPTFVEESTNVMYVDLPDLTTGACPSGDIPVYRVWDSRVDSNHRYTTSLVIRAQMVAKGWIAEGYGPDQVIMCAPQ